MSSEIEESQNQESADRRLRMAEYIVQKPLLIEAYVYDGKTDFKVIRFYLIDRFIFSIHSGTSTAR